LFAVAAASRPVTIVRPAEEKIDEDSLFLMPPAVEQPLSIKISPMFETSLINFCLFIVIPP